MQLGGGYEDSSNGLSFSPHACLIPGHSLADHEIPGSELYLIIVHVGNRHLWKEISSFIEIYLCLFFSIRF